MTDRHKNRPKAVRMPDGLEARIGAALEDGEKVNAFIVAAIEERLERRGSTTSAAPAEPVAPPKRSRRPRADIAPAATFKQAEPQRRAHAQTCKCTMCKPTGGKP